jgi:CBS domain-containing protein
MSIEQDLQTEKIAHLDLTGFAVVQSGTAISTVLQLMRENHISAVLVKSGERLVGIFTERDVLIRVADDFSTWDQPVDSVMTAEPQTVSLDERVGRALRLMNAGHYRNVPVLDASGALVGNLSQHVIIRFLTDRFPREIYNLPPDPEMIPKTREGA